MGQRLPDAALLLAAVGERLGDRVVLMMAENAGKPVAGALNLAGSEALYGRNWGCRGDWPFLHFELCYYRAIDWAIAHGLQRVEAGAQGRHKIQRGYLPRPDLLGALDRAYRSAPRDRQFPAGGDAGGSGGDGGLGGTESVSGDRYGKRRHIVIEVWTWPTPNGHKVHIALEELGLPYEVVADQHRPGRAVQTRLPRHHAQSPHSGDRRFRRARRQEADIVRVRAPS